MINFIITGLGEADTALKFVDRLRRLFRTNFPSCKVYFYDSEYLSKYKASPALLNTSSKFGYINHPEGFEKNYFGYFKNEYNSIRSIYERLFVKDEIGDFFSPEKEAVPYSEQALLDRLRYHFKSGVKNSIEEPKTDLEIGFTLKKEDINLFYAEIAVSADPVRSPISLERYLEWFEEVVHFCDVNYPECFHSAYASMNPTGFGISHRSIFSRYDLCDYSERIFGCEWYGYICKRIVKTLSDEQCRAICDLCETTEYRNGFSYRSRIPMQEYMPSDSLALYGILDDKLMPGIGFWSWQDFSLGEWSFSHPVKEVKIYQNMFGDKFVMIPFKCWNKKRERLIDLDYLEHFKTYRNLEL